jgi:hypothetical protein
MEDKKLGYVLLGAALVLSGFWLYNNKNKSKKEGSSVSSDTTPQNDATKIGMPFRIDVTHITVDANYNVHYPSLIEGQSMFYDNENHKIIIEVDDYAGYTQSLYDGTTGAFLKIVKGNF